MAHKVSSAELQGMSSQSMWWKGSMIVNALLICIQKLYVLKMYLQDWFLSAFLFQFLQKY